MTPDPERDLIFLSRSAPAILLGSVTSPGVAGNPDVSNQNEGKSSQPVGGEGVIPIHPKENKSMQAAPAAMGHWPTILSTACWPEEAKADLKTERRKKTLVF